MRTLELTKQQARHLVKSMDRGSSKALNIGQLRRISGVLDRMTEQVAGFNCEIERIEKTSKDGCERDDLLRNLLDEDKKNPLRIELEDADYVVLKDQWDGLEFSSSKFARDLILGIDDAMQAAQAEKV